MAFERPTFTEILDRVKADFDSRLPGTDAKLRRSVIGIIAYVIAGVSHGLYGFLSFIAKQVFPDTAEAEYLNRWGSIWGVTRKPATKASGTVIATGIEGTIIPAGAELQRSDAVIFVTKEEKTITSGTAVLPIESFDTGENTNTDKNVTLSFISPLSGIDSNTTVGLEGLTGGSNIEDDESYLSRILSRIQEPPHGGNQSDYKQWTLEVSGITRAWVYPQELGIGTVTIRFMMDDTYSNGIPLTLDVLNVQSYIDERRPVTSTVTVLAPVPVPLNFTIQLINQDTAAIRSAIQKELEDLIRREAEPSGILYISRINESISTATGEYAHSLLAPTLNVTTTTGQITTFGNITWI